MSDVNLDVFETVLSTFDVDGRIVVVVGVVASELSSTKTLEDDVAGRDEDEHDVELLKKIKVFTLSDSDLKYS